MSLIDKLTQIDLRRKEIGSLLPLDPKREDAFWKKVRLEWNYNSNHIEGNTLTYKETELLLIFDETNGEHKLREFQEMKAHDVALKLIRDWAKSERRISESDIRELNKIILVEPFWKEAISYNKEQTQILIEPGVYKKAPNHVLLSNGEIFKYAEPFEVSPKMADLLEWYYNDEGFHPVQKAALFHYKFILIHPFGDGNGRIARLLMNFHLLANEFPAVIIKSQDKKNYLQALHKADVGYEEAFIEYVADQSLWSIDLLRRAALGEQLEEVDDWIKEVELLKREGSPEPLKKTNELLERRLFDSIAPALFAIYSELSSQFDLLFDSKILLIKLENEDISVLITKNLFQKFVDRARVYFPNKAINIEGHFRFRNYKKNGTSVFDVEVKFEFTLEEFSYTFNLPALLDSRIRKEYSEVFKKGEIELMNSRIGKFLIDQIKSHIN